MFEKLLVANRGEIAVRIIRACRELNIRTVAVYSEADANSMHVQLADEAVCIGPGPGTDSYLRIDRIIGAAEITDVDAIHPGYGFLSENAHFADVCESCKIAFIGPGSKVMNNFGDKQTSRELAAAAGVPVPPGSKSLIEDEQAARKAADEIGYPVMIKAVAGGGGRGMRVAHNNASLIKSYHTARTEAEKSFGNSGVYIEKFIENPHHIEFQILGDKRGNIIHVGERDCSMQRRNQKLIEETPSPLLETRPELRQAMGEAAVRLSQRAEYVNAGTVEFIADDNGNYYFLEVNKRIQVEHPITEEVTGVDLVKQQILIAMGEPLRISQDDIRLTGHAIECRINAEDAYNNFCPSPGRIELYYSPGGRGVRVDTHAYAGYTIPPYYDSMIGKLITHGKDRREAIARMSRALGEYMITGIKTTIPFEAAILRDPNFRRGVYSTSFIENMLSLGQHEAIEKEA
ncbi:MAG: acetyl-CoA carboxylase biotin carboxylase subunit [Verrucomicrobiales bacterium]|nr:acetyl-CoA carboxylase biotin carboxylase subunit [Verrucomicrobiales bacterium]|tara:strand:- start:934 stop:2313 length:1380 start_codon:yes stop_codon:yes gene_type:complete